MMYSDIFPYKYTSLRRHVQQDTLLIETFERKEKKFFSRTLIFQQKLYLFNWYILNFARTFPKISRNRFLLHFFQDKSTKHN